MGLMRNNRTDKEQWKAIRGGGSYVTKRLLLTGDVSLTNKTDGTVTEKPATSSIRLFDNGSEILVNGFILLSEDFTPGPNYFEVDIPTEDVGINGIFNIMFGAFSVDEDLFVTKKLDHGISRISNNSIHIVLKSTSTLTLRRIDFCGAIPKI